MIKNIAAFLALLICLQACTKKSSLVEKYFHQKRVLILGNSITQNGTYVSCLQYLLKEEFPAIETDIISIGLSSETVSCLTENDHPYPRPCLSERLDRALVEIKPDVIFACYGMNDGIYHPLGEDRKKAYQDGISNLLEKAKDISAEVVLLTPPPFDPKPIAQKTVSKDAVDFGYATPFEGYDNVLGNYSQWLMSLKSPKLHIIDWHTAINQHVEQMRLTDSSVNFSQDGVHPGGEGHLFMATSLLEGLGANLQGQYAWKTVSKSPAFTQIHDQRQLRSLTWMNYVGYTRGNTVKSFSPKPILILMGGQSNMVGSGRKAELPDTNLPLQIKYIQFGKHAKLIENSKNFGPELGLSRVLAAQFPDQPFILLKYAVGGSSLLDWAPVYSKEKAEITGNAAFGNMFAHFLQKIDSIQIQYQVESTALLWMQGERDARIPEAGKDYKQNMEQLITAFRAKTKQADLPFVMGIVNPPIERYPALHTVQAAQREIAESMPNVYAFETDDYPKHKDQVHYNTEGVLGMGEKFGEILSQILKTK